MLTWSSSSLLSPASSTILSTITIYWIIASQQHIHPNPGASLHRILTNPDAHMVIIIIIITSIIHNTNVLNNRISTSDARNANNDHHYYHQQECMRQPFFASGQGILENFWGQGSLFPWGRGCAGRGVHPWSPASSTKPTYWTSASQQHIHPNPGASLRCILTATCSMFRSTRWLKYLAYNQCHGKHLYQLVQWTMNNERWTMFIMHHHTALVKLHVRIASWRWNAWKISDVSEHSGGAVMHNKCIYQRIWAYLDIMGRLGHSQSAHLGTLLRWRSINLGGFPRFDIHKTKKGWD